ncbi:MAG: 4-hydroxy-tetrahydrodipicolinate synthase [Firmicutes bacterium]|nr:4-hydroxy-tetrahydrodipicolinate synthase [Bacillota bacterium]
MKKPIFRGIATALITPFYKNTTKIDYAEFKKLIDFQCKNSVSALVFLGTTGEASSLSEFEQIEVVKFAVSYVNKRVPVIVGCGTNSTRETIKKAILFESLGADALMVVTPYYNRPTQEGLYAHFSTVAKCVSLPIMLYNVPTRTGINMLPTTVARLAGISNIVAVKEASGNMEQYLKIRKLAPEISLLSGEDSLLYSVLSIGGDGVVSVVSNILPKVTSEICELYATEPKKALELQLKMLPVIESLFSEPNPIPIKHAIEYVGIKGGGVRLPLTSPTKETKGKIKQSYEEFKI